MLRAVGFTRIEMVSVQMAGTEQGIAAVLPHVAAFHAWEVSRRRLSV
jgi:hypothetical protein